MLLSKRGNIACAATPLMGRDVSAFTDRPLLLIDQVIYVAVGVFRVHKSASFADFSSICALHGKVAIIRVLWKKVFPQRESALDGRANM